MSIIEFSVLKRDIVLIIIRDYETVDASRKIQTQLNIGIEQMFHIIDYLIDLGLLEFNEGKICLTSFAYDTLRLRNLDKFHLKDIEKYQFKINEKILLNYIPKSF